MPPTDQQVVNEHTPTNQPAPVRDGGREERREGGREGSTFHSFLPFRISLTDIISPTHTPRERLRTKGGSRVEEEEKRGFTRVGWWEGGPPSPPPHLRSHLPTARPLA